MLTITLYGRLIQMTHQAGDVFWQYEKYSTCFAVSFIDEAMQAAFQRTCLAYGKISRMVFGETGSVLRRDGRLLADPGRFFRNAQLRLELYSRVFIGMSLEPDQQVLLMAQLDIMKTAVSDASKLVARMELMLRGSQQVYEKACPERVSA